MSYVYWSRGTMLFRVPLPADGVPDFHLAEARGPNSTTWVADDSILGSLLSGDATVDNLTASAAATLYP